MNKQATIVAGECSACRSRRNRRTVLIAVVAASIAYAGGYLASTLQARGQVQEQAIAQFQKFVLTADELGLIDRRRLHEVSAFPASDGAERGNPRADAEGRLQDAEQGSGARP